MSRSNEEILNALKVIKEACEDCENCIYECVFAKRGECRITSVAPASWELNEKIETWRAFTQM